MKKGSYMEKDTRVTGEGALGCAKQAQLLGGIIAWLLDSPH